MTDSTRIEDERRRPGDGELALVEKRLRLMTEAASLATWEIDLPTGRSTWSERARRFLGLAPGVEALSKTWLERIHPDDRPHVEAAFERACDPAGDGRYKAEYRVVHDDGTIYWLADRALVDFEGDGPARCPAIAVGVAADITPRRRAEQRLAVEHDVSRILARAAGVEDGIPAVLDTILEGMGACYAAFWRPVADGRVLRCSRFVTTGDPAGLEAFLAQSRTLSLARGEGLPGRAWSAGTAAWIESLQVDPNFPRSQAAVACGLRSGVAMPIPGDQGCLGVIEWFSRERIPYDPELLAMMGALGAEVGHFLLRTRAEQARRDSDERHQLLYEAGGLLSETLDAETIYERMRRIVARTVQVDGLIVSSFDPGEGLIRCEHAWADGQRIDPTTLPPVRFNPGAGMQSEVIAAGEPRIFHDVRARTKNPRGTFYQVSGAGQLERIGEEEPAEARCAIMVPLLLGGRVTGVVQIMSDAPGAYGERELETLSAVVRQLAVALQNARLYRRAMAEVAERKLAEEAVREREARFRSLANTIPAIVWTAAADGTITFHNQRWRDYSGIQVERGTRDWAERVLHPDDRERWNREWTRAVREGAEFEIETRNRRHDGEYRWFLTRATPIRDGEGRLAEWYGSTTDVHDAKQAEEALKEADRRKDEFLATLAHELRNPLAPVRNSLDLMRLAGNDPDLLDRARSTMERQIAQMVRLIDDLLDVSRITRNRLELRRRAADLAPVVLHAVEATRPLFEQARQELHVALPPEAIRLDADPERLTQVFGNLLNNACKYTEAGGRIWLSAEREDESVVVRVRDTGIGIPPERLPEVFELFTQMDRSLERSQGGLGIGLSLVKRIVEMHGGQVAAHSEGLGRGSEFVVRLPVLAGEPAPLPRHPSTGEAAPTATGRILVVDDNHDGAESLALLLRRAGAETRTAHDGQEAVEAAAAFRPDVILLDLGLPKMNGYEACRRIRSEEWGRDVRIVALTGWGQDEDRRRTTEAGFDGHLVKPVEHGALVALLNALSPRLRKSR